MSPMLQCSCRQACTPQKPWPFNSPPLCVQQQAASQASQSVSSPPPMHATVTAHAAPLCLAAAPASLELFVAGGFLYIALATIAPELARRGGVVESALQVVCVVGGVALMALIMQLE